MTNRTSAFCRSVFINCPFDREYWPLFEAIAFCILECGMMPRCSLEAADSGETRLSKIRRIIASCQYGIHDLSRVEASSLSGLPRYNMPFELGLDFGARAYGSPRLRRKRLLVLDAVPYRYQASLSDFSGQDIKAHGTSPSLAIQVVRDWLRVEARLARIPGARIIRGHFRAFSAVLPETCRRLGIQRSELEFVEYVEVATAWLRSRKPATAD